MPRRLLLAMLFMSSLAAGRAAADPGVFQRGVDPELGFNMVSWWNFGAQGQSIWQSSVQEMYDAGFREVSISPVRYVTLGTGNIPTSSGRGPELSHIEAAIVRAKSLDMRVTVNPFVAVENFAFWRGQYDPVPGSAESNTFWADYQQYMVDVATLAETHGVDAMTIGTELKAIVQNPGNNGHWNSLISAVDTNFAGDLGYAANWDNFKNGNLTSTIWENSAIDFVGIDAYFRIVTTAQADASGSYPNPTFIDLVTSEWMDQIDSDILPFVDSRKGGNGMDLAFTEYGIAPFNRGVAQQPETAVVDQDEQLMGFEGLLRALDGRISQINAMHVWQWGMAGATGSHFYMDPDLMSNIGGGFDESLNTPTAAWLANFVSNPLVIDPDFNDDGQINGMDIDMLVENIAIGPPNPGMFDLNADGDVDLLDQDQWLTQAGAANLPSTNPYLVGDANLEGVVDGQDFIDWNNHKFTAIAAWTAGDFNADGVVDGRDFILWNDNKFMSADRVTTVPEPGAATLAWMALISLGMARVHFYRT